MRSFPRNRLFLAMSAVLALLTTVAPATADENVQCKDNAGNWHPKGTFACFSSDKTGYWFWCSGHDSGRGTPQGEWFKTNSHCYQPPKYP